MTEGRDTAGVIAPPPLLLAAAIVLGLLLDWLLPARGLGTLLPLAARIVIAFILIAAAATLAVPAIRRFRRAGTYVEPWKPSSSLVTGGIFAWLRNPMYVGATLLLAGLAILMASDWMLLMTAVFALVVHFGVVRREERYLKAKFGDAYRRYCEAVPRYGVPL
jgi:protein-S-isoprenylcysteine O-methyltransferase Ste14